MSESRFGAIPYYAPGEQQITPPKSKSRDCTVDLYIFFLQISSEIIIYNFKIRLCIIIELKSKRKNFSFIGCCHPCYYLHSFKIKPYTRSRPNKSYKS